LLGLSSVDDDEDERDKEEFENVDNIYVEYNLK
jgi:hypothetical protein